MQGDRSMNNEQALCGSVIDLWTMDRLCVRGTNGTESVDKGNGERKVRMQFSVSISPSRVGG